MGFLRRVWPQLGAAAEVKEVPTPGGVASNECCMACFGALLGLVAEGAGQQVGLKTAFTSVGFVGAVCRQVRLAFEAFRSMVEEVESRDVLQLEALCEPEGRKELLEGLVQWGGARGEAGGGWSDEEAARRLTWS